MLAFLYQHHGSVILWVVGEELSDAVRMRKMEVIAAATKSACDAGVHEAGPTAGAAAAGCWGKKWCFHGVSSWIAEFTCWFFGGVLSAVLSRHLENVTSVDLYRTNNEECQLFVSCWIPHHSTRFCFVITCHHHRHPAVHAGAGQFQAQGSTVFGHVCSKCAICWAIIIPKTERKVNHLPRKSRNSQDWSCNGCPSMHYHYGPSGPSTQGPSADQQSPWPHWDAVHETQQGPWSHGTCRCLAYSFRRLLELVVGCGWLNSWVFCWLVIVGWL